MTWLFIRFYLGVLIVLFLAWLIHGAVLKQRADSDLARVVTEAHGGGARLVAGELDNATGASREQELSRLRERFAYPLAIVPLLDLPSSVRRTISGGDDVAFLRPDQNRVAIVAALSNGAEVVQLGPFPDLDLKEIELSIGSWMRLTADKLDAVAPDHRPAALDRLQEQFDFPIELADAADLPDWPRRRLALGEEVVFYLLADDRWFSATPLPGGNSVVRFGPFPSFERIEQKAATTTVALVLLPAALAIALLLRPVARQLRSVEDAAKVIAAGDLSARVDERRMNSAKPLAQAFNLMANRTETLVRTQRELLQAVSHELRTPLSRMRFAIDLIETASDDALRKQRLEALDAAAEELDELVGELLRYVRMETAEPPQLSHEPVSLAAALEVLIPKHTAIYPAIQFAVNDQIDAAQTFIHADRTGLLRVLGNLLSNAGRFAQSRVVINVQQADGLTIVDVDDDGDGIPVSERERVFQPFVRLEDNANGHGVGLGLALVKRIVTQHGGDVTALASPSGGCRIRTTWPGTEPGTGDHEVPRPDG